jgi:transcriptional regulator with XRE-family HTH domain
MSRLRAQVLRLGSEARVARRSLGWTQSRVARLAHVSQATVSRFERGAVRVSVAALTSILAAVGLELGFRTFPLGVRLRDSGQLALADEIRRIAHASWRVMFEVPIGDASRRAADILLRGQMRAIHLELESNLADFQAQLRMGLLKRDELQRRFGIPVAFVLVLRDTERNRAAVRAHLSVIRAALPAGSREVLGAIRGGYPLERDGLLWLRPPVKPRVQL